jgi:hypothetical protein
MDGEQPFVCDASKGLVPNPDAAMRGPPNDTVCCLVRTGHVSMAWHSSLLQAPALW